MSLRAQAISQTVAALLSPPGQAAIAAAQALRARLVTSHAGPLLFLQIDDPYGYLLLQALVGSGELARLRPRVYVVGPPAADVDPEPVLAKAWARRDAIELAKTYGLEFAPPPAELSSASIDLAERAVAAAAASERWTDLLAACHAFWRHDEAKLQVLATAPTGATWSRLQRDANDQLLRRLGHYRGGMLLCHGQWSWGIDRLHYAAPAAEPRPVATPVQGLSDKARGESVHMFFSFRSPYSYIALTRAKALCDRVGATLTIRPILPMVLRGLPVPTQKKLYILFDAKREADRYGVPFGRVNDPVGGGGVERCLAIAPYAQAQRKLYDYVFSVATGIWSEGADVRDDSVLQRLCRRAGLDWSAARPWLARNDWQAMAEDNRRALFALGLWGVPSFQAGAFSTWGQDRLDILARHVGRGAS